MYFDDSTFLHLSLSSLFIEFDMSKAQEEHVLAIQYLAPRLAALRIEVCPCHMSERPFWKVYFGSSDG